LSLLTTATPDLVEHLARRPAVEVLVGAAQQAQRLAPLHRALGACRLGFGAQRPHATKDKKMSQAVGDGLQQALFFP
jgi:hypothetical protein